MGNGTSGSGTRMLYYTWNGIKIAENEILSVLEAPHRLNN